MVGLGEIGLPIFKLLSKYFPTDGFDKIEKLNLQKFSKTKDIELMHVCIPFTKSFQSEVIELEKKFKAKGIIIHSTISPNTTKKLQGKLSVPIIYSATRGVHKRMLKDLKRYTKFYSVFDWAPHSNWASKLFVKRMNKVGIKTKKMTNPTTLELAKILVDTTYYGWLINYAQITNVIAMKHKVDYDEMWLFAEEINKFLGNRPKLFPGYIGGHCVIPNLELMNDYSLNQIKKINESFRKFKK